MDIMNTALDFKTYKYKLNGIDTIVWRPADNKVKYGLFQQDKNGRFTVDVLNKYYNIPSYHSKFNEVYESVVTDVIVEISIKDILQKVKHKLKKFKGEYLYIRKHEDNTFGFPTMDNKEQQEFNKHLDNNVNLKHLHKHDLKLILAYLWPHNKKDNKEININQFVDNFSKSNESTKEIYVDKEALNFLRTGLHGLA